MSASVLGGLAPVLGPASAAPVHYFSGPEVSASGPPQGLGAADPINSTFKQLVDALQGVNGEQTALDNAARQMEGRGAQVMPGDMVMLSMRCNEFMFHCELTSNAANRSSDGLQELFREQS